MGLINLEKVISCWFYAYFPLFAKSIEKIVNIKKIYPWLLKPLSDPHNN